MASTHAWVAPCIPQYRRRTSMQHATPGALPGLRLDLPGLSIGWNALCAEQRVLCASAVMPRGWLELLSPGFDCV